MRRHVLSFFACLTILVWASEGIVAQGFKFLEVKVVDPDGKPLADVPVEIRIDGTEFPMPTNEDGIVSINVPDGATSELELSVSHEGYASVSARWAKGNIVPEQFTIPLQKGKTIGGVVQDENGQPVSGVRIEALATADDGGDLYGGKGELKWSIARDLGTTDSDGRWQTDSAPPEDVSIQMRFLHPDYVKQTGFDYRAGTWDELQSLKKIVVIQKGVTVTGTIMDQDGEPIAGARIVTGSDRYYSDKLVVTSDDNGAYQLPEPQIGRLILTVTAPGYAPELKTIVLGKDTGNVDFQLAPANTIRLRIIDQNGAPVGGAKVYAEEWRGNRSLEITTQEKSNDLGEWEWHEAPADEVKYGFSKEGHIGLETELTPGEEVQTVTLYPVVVVNGTVVDKESRKPIESFRYIEGVWWDSNYDRYILQTHSVEIGKNGSFQLRMTSACAKFCVRVEAEGYRPAVSREILPTEGEIEVEFELEKGFQPAGTVLTPDGQPAVGAAVAIGGARMPLMVSNAQVQEYSSDGLTTTDSAGKFSLPVPDAQFAVVVLHDAGWAELTNPHESDLQAIRLVPWSQVEGLVVEGEEPSAQERVIARTTPRGNTIPSTQWYSSGMTDEQGKYQIDRLPAGPTLIHKSIKYAVQGPDRWMTAYSHLGTIELKPGETAHAKIGGAGRRVEGRLTVANKHSKQVDWNLGLVELMKIEKEGTASADEADYASGIEPDGRFAISDVRPGKYTMKVTVYPEAAASNGRWIPVVSLKQPCEVPEGTRDDVADLGSFTVELVKSQD